MNLTKRIIIKEDMILVTIIMHASTLFFKAPVVAVHVMKTNKFYSFTFEPSMM